MQDGMKGYRGRARARLEAQGVKVWSEVRVVNDAGSVFEGVILPRSETLDDEHIVIKMRNGYNVGVHISRIAQITNQNFALDFKCFFFAFAAKQFP